MSGDYDTFDWNQGRINYTNLETEKVQKFDVPDIQIVMRQVESIHCQVAEYPTGEYLQEKLEYIHEELNRLKDIYDKTL
jgi:hypothetical protein